MGSGGSAQTHQLNEQEGSAKFQKITGSIDAIFNEFASGPSGIGAEHLRLSMHFLGLNPTQEEVKHCLDKMGRPSYLERATFHHLMQEELEKHLAKVQVQEVTKFLKEFDAEGKGSLSAEDFQKAMGGSISDEKLQALLLRIPRNSQGELEFIEIAKCFQLQEPQQPQQLQQLQQLQQSEVKITQLTGDSGARKEDATADGQAECLTPHKNADDNEKKVLVALLSGKDCECMWLQDRTIRQLKEEAQQKLDIAIKHLIGPNMEPLDEEKMLQEENIVPGTVLTVVAVDQAAEDEKEASECSSIFHAARLGRLGALRHFLRTPGAAAARDDQRRSALHHAAGDGHAALCRVLLEAKAEVDPTDDFDGMTPLHFAAFKGRLDVVKLLLEAKASMTVEDTEGSSPLHNAAFYGHIDVVKMLVEAKAPVAATDINGETPLENARSRGHTEVARILESAAVSLAA